jgi:hypothetical protein
MMKKLILPVLLGLAALASLPTQAATATGNFNVVVNLTSACKLSTPPAALTIAYTSLGGATSATTDFSVLCSQGMAYTLALDAANADTLGLAIPLAIRTGTDSGPAAGGTQGATALPTAFKVKASMIAGQQGNCAAVGAGVCTSTVARILTVTY